MRRQIWLLIGFVVAVAGVALLAQSSRGTEKSFSLPLVAVDADLAPDGSMRVVEHITYDFDGHFSYGTRPIPPGATYSITDMSVSEGGIPIITTSGAPYDLVWTFDADDERRTFDIA